LKKTTLRYETSLDNVVPSLAALGTMFSRPRLYDQEVLSATDENLMSEDWEAILAVTDKVSSDTTSTGPREALGAIQKRLSHRNANVQVFALTLTDSLVKNCGLKVWREVASRSFTQALVRLVNDRTTHDKPRVVALELIKQWRETFAKDPSLSLIDETYSALFAGGKYASLDKVRESVGFGGSGSGNEQEERRRREEAREREEQDFARALEMSREEAASRPRQEREREREHGERANSAIAAPTPAPATAARRVKALYDFTPTEPGELAFKRGDIITVLDSAYKDWWRGTLSGTGTVGIFPVNYIEPIEELDPDALAKEFEMEATVFNASSDIDKLLAVLVQVESRPDQALRMTDDEEFQRLYQQTLALRPKIVKLIDKYARRRNELVSMHERFARARREYDRMMEENLSRYTVPTRVEPERPVANADHFSNGQMGHAPGGYPAGGASGPTSSYPSHYMPSR